MTTIGHQFHATVLREYDIRGVVGETLTTEDATALGRSFGSLAAENGGSRVCVGYDGRHSSPDMEAALGEGLISTGINVDRIGRNSENRSHFICNFGMKFCFTPLERRREKSQKT